MLYQTLGRVFDFVRRRRKLTIVLVAATILLVANVGSVLGFEQTTKVDGVRVETNKAAYGIGQTPVVSMFLVNKLDQAFDTCVGFRDILFKNPLGTSEGLRMIIDYTANPHCGNIQPGEERLEDTLDSWRPLLPGVYTIHVSMVTLDPTFPRFEGNATILVVGFA